jgi:3-methyl-2-oxobutanoate hydroxymethyltransferase
MATYGPAPTTPDPVSGPGPHLAPVPAGPFAGGLVGRLAPVPTITEAPKVTAPSVRARKGSGRPLVMVTAYDAPTARVADGAGVDLILVGDSLAMVVLGYDDTLHVTVEDMAHHTGAVARTNPRPMIVSDLPWMSYHTGPADAVRNAATLVRAGGQAVKLEGGRKRLPVIEAIIDAEVPVMGHLGLTPQSFHAMGGFKVQGKDLDSAAALVEDAQALADVGCFALVLEGIPDVVAQLITESIDIPTIGIGAGPHCDGQVLVFHDVLGFDDQRPPKFVRRYAALQADATVALGRWADDVRTGRFPDDSESYHMATSASPAMVAAMAGSESKVSS